MYILIYIIIYVHIYIFIHVLVHTISFPYMKEKKIETNKIVVTCFWAKKKCLPTKKNEKFVVLITLQDQDICANVTT